jgi:hypothetical protein
MLKELAPLVATSATLPLNLKIRRATRAGRIEAPLRDLPRPALASGPAARAEAR